MTFGAQSYTGSMKSRMKQGGKTIEMNQVLVRQARRRLQAVSRGARRAPRKNPD
ncbi:MAG TPA: hypothetical protein VFP70_07820 [Burkholderiales bacterium]|nr:hypothetical protein [Burkholderiales bacterium]